MTFPALRHAGPSAGACDTPLMTKRTPTSPAGDADRLRAQHTPAAVQQRLAAPTPVSYLRDFIYGAIDGAVTTFAVVAGATGAGLSHSIVVIMGVANLVADGFSMGVSNFLGSRAEAQQRERARHREERHIRLNPEGEREEIRQLFAAKGLDGETLEHVVDAITGDRERWIDTMMAEELGYGQDNIGPLRAAGSTFVAFLIVGSLPLSVFIVNALGAGIPHAFLWSGILTAVAFFGVGSLKARVVDQAWWRSGLETLAIGGAAAALAYVAGVVLEGVG